MKIISIRDKNILCTLFLTFRLYSYGTFERDNCPLQADIPAVVINFKVFRYKECPRFEPITIQTMMCHLFCHGLLNIPNKR